MYLQDLLKFEPGRGYRAFLMPKGKGASKKPSKPYVREQRRMMVVEKETTPGQEEKKRMSPESHKKIVLFLKEQIKETSDFVSETDEERFRGEAIDSDDDEVMQVDDGDNELQNDEQNDELMESDDDSDISEIDEYGDHISDIED